MDRVSRTAIHEGAHAVVALELGLEVVDVELRAPPADPGGFCRVRGPLEGFRGAVVLLSGECAAALGSELSVPALTAEPEWLFRARVERSVTPPEAWWMQPSTPSGDHEVEKARAMAGAQDEAARDEAFRIVREHWSSVAAVAERLLEEGKLEGSEVARIHQSVRPASRAPAPRRKPRRRAPATTAQVGKQLERVEVRERRYQVAGRTVVEYVPELAIYR